MNTNDIISALHGSIFGSVLWLLLTITFETGKWMFNGYSDVTAMLLYFIVAIIFIITFGLIGVFVGRFFDKN